jgi:hypothetical protein
MNKRLVDHFRQLTLGEVEYTTNMHGITGPGRKIR